MKIYLLPYFKLGARRLTRFLMPLPLTGIISVNKRFVRFDVTRRLWLLPPFVRTSFPDPVSRNLLEVALWVFNLYLLVFCLRGTSITPLKQNPAEHNSSADYICKCLLLLTSSCFLCYFFFVFAGARTINIALPSNEGFCSTTATSDNSSAISLKFSKAISG